MVDWQAQRYANVVGDQKAFENWYSTNMYKLSKNGFKTIPRRCLQLQFYQKKRIAMIASQN